MANMPGLTKPESPYFVKALEGQDTTTKDLSLTGKGDIAQNCRFGTEFGSVVKRPTMAFYNSTAEGNSIQSVYRYYRKANDTAYLIQINGNLIRVGNDSNGTFATIATLPSSTGHRFTAVTYNDLALFSTGYDNIMQTDGAVAWELGSCKAALGSSGSIDSGNHYYACIFVTSTQDVVNGAVSNTVTSIGSQVNLSNIPIGPTGCTARKIYRTTAGGNTLKLLTTISDNSTTTYADNTADSGLGTTMAGVNNDMPKGKYLYVEQERLFVTGDPNAANTVYYSELYLPHFIATASSDLSTIPASDYYDFVGRNDNDIITGMAGYLGITFVFKQNSIRPYYIAGTPDTWTLGGIVSKQGCPAPYTIVSTPYGILYQGWDFYYTFNGNWSLPFFTEFLVQKEMSSARQMMSVAEYHRGQYMVAYTDASLGHQYHDRVLVYDIITKQLAIDKGGTMTGSPGTNVNINCLCSARGGSDEGQLYAGDSISGYVYKYNRDTQVIKYTSISDLNTGAYTEASSINSENNPILTCETLDDMNYSTDALAQAAWVTSQTLASKKIPPNLGNGLDGAVTISADTTLTGDMNYTSLTISSGVTLTGSSNSTIYCLGTLTINGTLATYDSLSDLTICAQTITVGTGGSINGVMYLRANTINNSGNIQTEVGDGAPASYSQYQQGGNLSGSCSSMDTFASCTVTQLSYSLYAHGDTDGYSSAPNSSASCTVEILQNGSWTTLYSNSSGGGGHPHNASLSGPSTGSWTNVTGIRASSSSSASADHDCAVSGNTSISAYISPTCDYINSTGTVPVSTDTSDFGNALDCYSENAIVNQGNYSLRIVAPAGADTFNQYLVKTISATDLGPHNTLLIDVYALRSGANFQFGIGNSAYTDNLYNITVPVANTWSTLAITISSATRNAITKLGFKITNSDSGNIICIDNIRPSNSTATWVSPVLNINASTLGNMYWNQYLGTYGTVSVYTRNASTSSGCSSSTWSSALSNPAGSPIVSTGGSTNPADMQYFQFKVVMTTAQTQTPNPDYAQFPCLFQESSYVIKFDYYKALNAAESAVEFKYRTGYRNFDEPFADKIYKKIVSVHEGIEGQVTLSYDLDNETGQSYSYTIDLSQDSYRWESFFPDTAFGRAIRFEWYKNDAYDFKIKQIGAIIESEPVI